MKGCMRLVAYGLIAVIVLAVLAAIFGEESTDGGTATQPTASTATPDADGAVQVLAQEPPTNTPPPAVGQDVIVDEVRWKVLAAENLGNTLQSDNQFIDDKTTSGMYIRVRFELENLSNDMLTFAGIDLADDQGRTYTRASDAFSYLPDDESCTLENLNPNITKTCTHIFEVPTNATGLQAILGDLKLFGSAEARVDLGL